MYINKTKLTNTFRRKKGQWIANIFLFLFFVGMVYIFTFPLLYMLSVAIREIGRAHV